MTGLIVAFGGSISIHALVKRATILCRRTVCRRYYFNPRPRKEGDTLTVTGVAIADISIHALVKRATPALIDLLDEVGISIHALVKRATEPLHNVSESDMYFNPRPRKEGDFSAYVYGVVFVNFNPRPRKEGDGFNAFIR